jgi:ADP-dependent NAD(P)H-hydrate dehydratase / NAD(P)H-hydrate epimerase
VPIVSIDLPSGIATDSGAVLGQAICATQTLCLGLWKRAFFQEAAVPYLGGSRLIAFDIPEADIATILGDSPIVQAITDTAMLDALPLHRSPIAHKYQMGDLATAPQPQ